MVNNRMVTKSVFIFLVLYSFLALVSGQQIYWSDESLISSSPNSTQKVMYPSVATDSEGNIHIIWMKQLSSQVGEVFYSKMDEFGNVIVNNRQLSNFSGIHGFRSDVVVDKKDNVHIIWEYDRIGTLLHGTRYTRLDENGNILVNGVMLNGTGTGIHQLALDNDGNIVVAWGGEDIYYTKYDNFGRSLNNLIYVLPISPNFETLVVRHAVDSNNNLHIVWMEENITRFTNPVTRIKYSLIDSDGNPIVHDLQLDGGLSLSTAPSIAIDKDDNVYISWHSSNGSIDRLYLSKINKSGIFTMDRKPLPPGIGESVIGVDPLGNVNLIDGSTFLQLNSTGDPIIGPINMGAISIGSDAPKMTIDRQGAIHFVWHVIDDEIRRYQINYRRSLNPATINMSGIPRQGSTIQFRLQDIYNINGSYYFGISTGRSPGMTLYDGRRIPLNDDDLLKVSLSNPQNIGLANSIGVLNPYNQAIVSFTIPKTPELNGTTLYGSFITVDSSNRIVSISDAIAFTIL